MIIMKNLNGDIYTGVDLIYMDTRMPVANHEADLRVVLPGGNNYGLCGFRKKEQAEKMLAAIYEAMQPAGAKNPNHIFVDLKELHEKVVHEDGEIQK